MIRHEIIDFFLEHKFQGEMLVLIILLIIFIKTHV